MHDKSATGQHPNTSSSTQTVVHLANELRKHEIEGGQETERALSELAMLLVPWRQTLHDSV
jgi:dsDNA-specific endonuclease/ATPase MutS2